MSIQDPQERGGIFVRVLAAHRPVRLPDGLKVQEGHVGVALLVRFLRVGTRQAGSPCQPTSVRALQGESWGLRWLGVPGAVTSTYPSAFLDQNPFIIVISMGSGIQYGSQYGIQSGIWDPV